MTLFKYLFPKSTLKRKTLDIKDDIKKLVRQNCTESFSIIYYGAYDIDPRHLVYWVCVKTDRVKTELQTNGTLNADLRDLLIKNNYPQDARASVFIGFESQQTVDRESKGNWYVHFK